MFFHPNWWSCGNCRLHFLLGSSAAVTCHDPHLRTELEDLCVRMTSCPIYCSIVSQGSFTANVLGPCRVSFVKSSTHPHGHYACLEKGPWNIGCGVALQHYATTNSMNFHPWSAGDSHVQVFFFTWSQHYRHPNPRSVLYRNECRSTTHMLWND